MRTAIFLFLVLMIRSTLFAYDVNVTKFTDENFDPLPKEAIVIYKGLIIRSKLSKEKLMDFMTNGTFH